MKTSNAHASTTTWYADDPLESASVEVAPENIDDKETALEKNTTLQEGDMKVTPLQGTLPFLIVGV